MTRQRSTATTSHRTIASPLTEGSSVIVLDHAEMTSANDNVGHPSQRHRPHGNYRVPIAAFSIGFVLAGFLVAIERVLTLVG
jgi:hypothetical protein